MSSPAHASIKFPGPFPEYDEFIEKFDNYFFNTKQSGLNSVDLEQIKCMTDNVYYEARGESVQGQIAVNHVVLNRVKDSRFPTTPCGVVKQRSSRGCQFSWVCTVKRYVIGEQGIYNKLEDISKKVYLEEINDNTNGAKFYHATYVRPAWSHRMTRTTRIGSHIFYRG